MYTNINKHYYSNHPKLPWIGSLHPVLVLVERERCIILWIEPGVNMEGNCATPLKSSPRASLAQRCMFSWSSLNLNEFFSAADSAWWYFFAKSAAADARNLSAFRCWYVWCYTIVITHNMPMNEMYVQGVLCPQLCLSFSWYTGVLRIAQQLAQNKIYIRSFPGVVYVVNCLLTTILPFIRWTYSPKRTYE